VPRSLTHELQDSSAAAPRLGSAAPRRLAHGAARPPAAAGGRAARHSPAFPGAQPSSRAGGGTFEGEEREAALVLKPLVGSC